MAATRRDVQKGSIVSGSSIIAAGLASAVAAGVTSRFGWAGTIIGAALTTMIITGGSAILNAYLQSMKSRVQAAPGNIRAAARQARPQRQGGLPGAPGLRDNFAGRLRGALGWFSRLPIYQRRSILRRGLIGAVAALVVGLIAITVVEFGIGNSYSCGFWGNCPVSSAPGFGGGNAYDTTGARTGYSILAGRSADGAQRNTTYGQQVQPQQQGGGLFGGGQSQPAQPQPQDGGLFGGGQGQQGGGGWAQPQQPVQPTPVEPVQPQQPVQPTPAEPVQPQPSPVQPQTPAPAE